MLLFKKIFQYSIILIIFISLVNCNTNSNKNNSNTDGLESENEDNSFSSNYPSSLNKNSGNDINGKPQENNNVTNNSQNINGEPLENNLENQSNEPTENDEPPNNNEPPNNESDNNETNKEQPTYTSFHTGTYVKKLDVTIEGETFKYNMYRVNHDGNCLFRSATPLLLSAPLTDWNHMFDQVKNELVDNQDLKDIAALNTPSYNSVKQTDDFEKLWDDTKAVISRLKAPGCEQKKLDTDDEEKIVRFTKQVILFKNILKNKSRQDNFIEEFTSKKNYLINFKPYQIDKLKYSKKDLAKGRIIKSNLTDNPSENNKKIAYDFIYNQRYYLSKNKSKKLEDKDKSIDLHDYLDEFIQNMDENEKKYEEIVKNLKLNELISHIKDKKTGIKNYTSYDQLINMYNEVISYYKPDPKSSTQTKEANIIINNLKREVKDMNLLKSPKNGEEYLKTIFIPDRPGSGKNWWGSASTFGFGEDLSHLIDYFKDSSSKKEHFKTCFLLQSYASWFSAKKADLPNVIVYHHDGAYFDYLVKIKDKTD